MDDVQLGEVKAELFEPEFALGCQLLVELDNQVRNVRQQGIAELGVVVEFETLDRDDRVGEAGFEPGDLRLQARALADGPLRGQLEKRVPAKHREQRKDQQHRRDEDQPAEKLLHR